MDRFRPYYYRMVIDKSITTKLELFCKTNSGYQVYNERLPHSGF